MAFTCRNEIVIRGGSEEERRRAAALILAVDSVDEDSASRDERPQALVLRLESVDGLPEDELRALAPQFPELSFTLIYFSLDGEFYGYARLQPAGEGAAEAAESEDFGEDTRDLVGRRYDGDVIAFVRGAFGLESSGSYECLR
jgi:hypothetical protein